MAWVWSHQLNAYRTASLSCGEAFPQRVSGQESAAGREPELSKSEPAAHSWTALSKKNEMSLFSVTLPFSVNTSEFGSKHNSRTQTKPSADTNTFFVQVITWAAPFPTDHWWRCAWIIKELWLAWVNHSLNGTEWDHKSPEGEHHTRLELYLV